MMTLLFTIKYLIWWPFCFQNKDTITLRHAFLSICIFANLMKLATIFQVTENIKDFRTNFKTRKLCVAMATVGLGCLGCGTPTMCKT